MPWAFNRSASRTCGTGRSLFGCRTDGRGPIRAVAPVFRSASHTQSSSPRSRRVPSRSVASAAGTPRRTAGVAARIVARTVEGRDRTGRVIRSPCPGQRERRRLRRAMSPTASAPAVANTTATSVRPTAATKPPASTPHPPSAASRRRARFPAGERSRTVRAQPLFACRVSIACTPRTSRNSVVRQRGGASCRWFVGTWSGGVSSVQSQTGGRG
jgi:hypothetical protein